MAVSRVIAFVIVATLITAVVFVVGLVEEVCVHATKCVSEAVFTLHIPFKVVHTAWTDENGFSLPHGTYKIIVSIGKPFSSAV